jgi:hypothetical protein
VDVPVLVYEGNFLEPVEMGRGASKLLLAAGNGVVRRGGALVMGAGSARALAEAYPQAPRVLGEMARAGEKMPSGGWYLYGLLATPIRPDLQVGVFQTRGVWKEEADPLVIIYSTALLARWIRGHPNWEVHMAFPDVGPGESRRAEVLRALKRILEELLGALYQERSIFLYRP